MKLVGSFSPPGDKSISHRLALISLIASGKSEIQNFSNARDCITSVRLLAGMGADVKCDPAQIVINGLDSRLKTGLRLDCENSGTTIRLLMGLLSPNKGEFVLDGDSSLRNRPMERVAIPLRCMGANIECSDNGKPPVRIRGASLTGIEYELPVPSAQLKSAILFAGIQAEGLTHVVETVPSRDHTEILLKSCGANIQKTADGWSVSRSSLTMPQRYHVPGDISSACFFLCASIIVPGSTVLAQRVLLNPTRIGAVNVLERMNANIRVFDQVLTDTSTDGRSGEVYGKIEAQFSKDLLPFEVSAKETPLLVDEVPILALVATQANGTSIFNDVSELRVKESDRVEAIMSQLNSMGAKIETVGDSLLIHGPTKLRMAKKLRSFGDHRIAMTLKIAGLLADYRPEIDDETCIEISYPNFDDTLRTLAK